MAYRSPSQATTRAEIREEDTSAWASGRRTRKAVLFPGVLWTSTTPPRLSRFVRTTSKPTPRPETLVTSSRVENPGWKIRSTTARRLREAARSAVSCPQAATFSRMTSGSMPRPSSSTARMISPDCSRGQFEAPVPRLAGRQAVGRGLQPVVDGVADQVRERIGERVQHAPIQLQLASANREGDLLAELPGGTRTCRSYRSNSDPIGCIRVLTIVSWTWVTHCDRVRNAGSLAKLYLLSNWLRAITMLPVSWSVVEKPTRTHMSLSCGSMAASGSLPRSVERGRINGDDGGGGGAARGGTAAGGGGAARDAAKTFAVAAHWPRAWRHGSGGIGDQAGRAAPGGQRSMFFPKSGWPIIRVSTSRHCKRTWMARRRHVPLLPPE